MADRGDTHYHVPNMNRWFLFSSLFFTATIVWTVIDDWNAEWKTYQREFRALELEKAEADLEELESGGALESEAELLAKVAGVEERLAEKRSELAELETEAYAAAEAMAARDVVYKKSSEDLKWMIFNAEQTMVDAEAGTAIETIQADMGIDEARAENAALLHEVNQLKAVQAEKEQAIATMRTELTEVEKELTVGTRDLSRVREKIDSLSPSDPSKAVANLIRDFPGLDFIGPNLKVQKYVLDGVEFELNFTKKQVIDMCTTCHMGMERVGFEDEEQPYAAHPRLDLFLSSKSPHPANEMGCTVCHRGSGESLSFQHADHRPSDEAEAEEWHDEQHWHKQHHWDYPMLKSDMVEASCVQCHKDSMELIAEDAPKVTEGYRLVERYGCYACHKIDWFPTKRRPGPSLLGMKSKLTPEWTEAWVADPRGYRPSTWMPQIFHLENYAADEPVVVSNYETGREIMGEEWNNNAVAAITAYLYENHDDVELPPMPVAGNAERGREVMNVVGCYACHNTAPWDGDEPLGNNSDEVGRYNDKGPNLRGVNTKINAEWLYHWLKNPADYWPDTNMPNLRLSDQDAADITAYMMEDPDGVFQDTPEGWAPAPATMDVEVLQEQARWFFGKLGRTSLDRAFNGEDPERPWTTAEALAPEVGKALVAHYGCFSCHDIDGMLEMMPIGAELSQWGTKTVDKLDFGLSYLRELTLPASLMGEEKTLPKLDHHYREGWLQRKLHHPRSFDIDKVKNPKEKLRMPWFDFDDEQTEAITTFIVGLVDDNVPGVKMEPNKEQLAMDAGMRQVRQKNCVACHVIEPASLTFEHENGEIVTVTGEFMPLSSDEPSPPKANTLEELLLAKADWEGWMEEELEAATFRLWGVHPDVGAGGQSIQVPFDKIVSVQPPEGGDFVKHVTDYYQFGALVENPDYDPNDEESYRTNPWTVFYDEEDGVDKIEDVDGQLRAYGDQEFSKVRWTFAPPVLVNEGYKIQSDWFYSFLMEPYGLRQQMRVKMPSFHYRDGEAQAIADYFLAKARKDYEPRYSRRARLALGRELKDGKGEPMWRPGQKDQWPVTTQVTGQGAGLSAEVMSSRMAADGTSLTPEKLEDIENGYAPEVAASFGKVHAWAEEQGFSMGAEPMFGYERIERQAPSYLAIHGDRIPLGKALATDKEGVNCYQCHPSPDGEFQQDPIAWAPALENVRTRLREDYVWDWLWNPAAIYPGTAMPSNFAADEPQYQEQYPDSDNEAQVEAVMDWLYNMAGAPRVQKVANAGMNPALITEDQLVAMLEQKRAEAAAAEQAATEAEAPAEEPAETTPAEEPAEEPAKEEEPAAPAVVSAPVTGAGIVSGRVVFDGDMPKIKPLAIAAKQSEGCCAPGESVDDTNRSLLIGAGSGVQNVVVTIEVDGASPQNQPSEFVLDQAKCRYEPRVVVLPVGSNILYKNSDSISHNVHTYPTKNEGKNFTLAAGGTAMQELDKEETFASGCDIHPWMKGYVVVTEASHWAITGADGSFSLTGLPPGDYKVSFWHETLGKAKGEVTVPDSGASEPMEVKMKVGGSGGGRRRR